MKKRYIIIILLLICFTHINAKSINKTFDEAKEIANNYITSSSIHEYYLINEELPFEFNNKNKIEKNSNFFKGGLLNLQEYNISKYQNKTYLRNGINYWTMTNSDKKYYVIKEKNEELYSIEDKHQARITEYVKKDTYVSGTGTYKNPWKFNKLNTIVFVSTDETKGIVSPKKTYALTGEDLAIKVNPTPGYEYASNTCDIETASNNGINIYNIQKDMYCEVSFKEKTYTLTYDNNGGSGCTSKQIVYGETYGELCTPVRNEYTFTGWFTKATGGVQITKDTIVNANIESEINLYAHWAPAKVTCDTLQGKIKCNNLTYSSDYVLEYNGDCEFICDDSIKGDWRIKFKTVGEVALQSKIDLKIDLFLVGGGGGGRSSTGGAGGGGYTNTYSNVNVLAGTHTVKVGNGGGSGSAGGQSYFMNTSYSANGGNGGGAGYQALGGAGGSGGSGGGGGGHLYGSGAKGSAGSFGNSGGGGAGNPDDGAPGGGGGSGQGRTTCEFEQGGSSSCYSGVTSYSKGGGTGGENKNNSGNGGTSGSGSSGIVIIRNARISDCGTDSSFGVTYTGTCQYIDDGDGNWKIKFLTSGTLNLKNNLNVDIFVVGGGGGGISGQGGAGGGGYTRTYSDISVPAGTHTVEVGNGGVSGANGGKSYFMNTSYAANGGGAGGGYYQALGGAGGSGGSGGGGGGHLYGSGAKGSAGSFGNNGGTGAGNPDDGAPGGGGGSGQGTTTCEFGQGTTSGCNSGVTAYSKGGGTGGENKNNSGNGGTNGSGSSGIVIIRNRQSN